MSRLYSGKIHLYSLGSYNKYENNKYYNRINNNHWLFINFYLITKLFL